MRIEPREIQAGVLERRREAAPEQVRRIVFVQRDPAGDQLLRLHVADDVRQHGGLAEAGRRPQHGEPPLQ